jgi:hypothetical protein
MTDELPNQIDVPENATPVSRKIIQATLAALPDTQVLVDGISIMLGRLERRGEATVWREKRAVVLQNLQSRIDGAGIKTDYFQQASDETIPQLIELLRSAHP